MFRTQFVVVECENGWKISHDGRNYGPYLSRQSAILAAIDAADRSQSQIFPARVLVESRVLGKMQVEWTHGDPHPAELEAFRQSVVQARGDLDDRKSSIG